MFPERLLLLMAIWLPSGLIRVAVAGGVMNREAVAEFN